VGRASADCGCFSCAKEITSLELQNLYYKWLDCRRLAVEPGSSSKNGGQSELCNTGVSAFHQSQ